MRVSAEDIEEHYEVLHKIGNLGATLTEGFLRAAYSSEESEAMRYIESAASSFGCESSWDPVGNLSIELPGESSQFVEFASHIDTVPCGGNFDGAAGVVAGLAALKAIAQQKERKLGVRLRIWRGEEGSTFNVVSIGSRAAFGELPVESLKNSFDGRSLRSAMESQDVELSFIEEGRSTIDEEELDGIAAHFELHIEQGKVLESSNVDIGVVTEIRGTFREWVFFSGAFDHSGATPLGAEHRKDVNLALAHFLVRFDQLSKKQGEHDLVQTVGVINSNRSFNDSMPALYQNAVPKVSGFLYFSLEVRSSENEFRNSYVDEVHKLLDETVDEFGVSVKREPIVSKDGVGELSSQLIQLSNASCRELGVSSLELPSGAWHDAALLAQKQRSNGEPIPVGMIFIPCKEGVSHNPKEFSSDEQLAKGASVLVENWRRLNE